MALDTSAPARSGPVSRRTVLKGAAWSAPVMIAAVAVPAQAASVTPTSIAPATVAFAGTGVQTTDFTLSPAPAVGASVSLAVTGPFVFNGGATATSVTVAAGGVISVALQPTGAGSGTLSVSGATWGPLAVSLTSPPTAITPNSATLGGIGAGSAQTRQFTLSPAPATNATVNLAVSGPFQLGATTAVVGAGGVISVSIQPTAAGSGTLTVSGVGGGSVIASLTAVATAISPTTWPFTNDSAQSKTFTLTPAPAAGTQVTVVATGIFALNGSTSPIAVGAGGTISVSVKPSGKGSGTLVVTVPGWSPLTVTLTR